MIMLGTFAGFSNSKSFGGWGGGVNAQWWKWASAGKKTNINSKWLKQSIGFDWRYKMGGSQPVVPEANPSNPGGWSSVDIRCCWVDASGCKTSDDTYYTHPKYHEQVRALTGPKEWENAITRKQNREDGYNDLIHYEESSPEALQQYLMDERTDNEFLHGGFYKFPNGEEWNLGMRGLLRPGAYLFGSNMYKVEFSITPATYELCSVDEKADYVDFEEMVEKKDPVTTTTTTTVTDTTTVTTTLFPSTTVTTITTTITPWYGRYVPGNLTGLTDKTLAPGRSLEWVVGNAPSWHPAPDKFRN